MYTDQETMKNLGVSSNNELSLELCARACTASSRLADYGVIFFTQSCAIRASHSACLTRVYWKHDDKDIVVVGVYVDDLLVIGTNVAAVDCFFKGLSSLSIKDLSQVSNFLGMRVVLNEDGGYLLDQEEAVTDLLREHRLSDANSTLAPIGSDFYEVHPGDGVLLDVKGKNALPTV